MNHPVTTMLIALLMRIWSVTCVSIIPCPDWHGCISKCAEPCQQTVPACIHTVIANDCAVGVASKVGVSLHSHKNFTHYCEWCCSFLPLSRECLETQSRGGDLMKRTSMKLRAKMWYQNSEAMWLSECPVFAAYLLTSLRSTHLVLS